MILHHRLSRPLPFLVLGVGVAVVSFAAILIRFAQVEGASSLAIAAVRLTVAAAVLTPFVWLRSGGEIMRLGRRPLVLCMLSGILLAAHFWAWITSLEYTSVASSTALVTTNPLWVALVSAVVLREHPGAAGLAGIVLTLVGSMLVFAADASRAAAAGTAPNLGNALALLGAISAS
ncbi:MAG TPA: DMT family transporter, partial [Burkholderiales bacterium]|nr:DMT family transporter [Burkholderiales bacterium]